MPDHWVNGRSRRTRTLLIALAGGVAALGQAPFSQPALALIGLALGFRLFAMAQTPWRALRFGMAFGTGYFLVALHWIVEPFLIDIDVYGWMAPFALVFLAVGLSLFWGLAFGAARWLSPGRWALILTFAAAEFIRAYIFTGFPWAMPGYAFVDGLAGQTAAWIGPHGLNLLTFAAAWALSLALRPGVWPLAAFAAGLGAVAAVATWPMPIPSPQREDRPLIRLVQPNAPQHQKWDPEYVATFFGRSIAMTAAPGEPDLIIWPETAIPTPLPRAGRAVQMIAEAAGGTPVVAGVQRLDGLLLFNDAILIGASGEVEQLYDKHHLVPFGEYLPFGSLLSRFGLRGLAAEDGNGYAAGPGPKLMDLGPIGRALPLICYEAVFPQDVGAAPERPDLLLQITNDGWFGQFSGPFQHLVQARMRAIEQGLPMLRSANTGVSAVIDARGRITAQLPLGETGHLDARLPEPHQPTLYARSGDWPLAVVLALALGLLALGRGIKTD